MRLRPTFGCIVAVFVMLFSVGCTYRHRVINISDVDIYEVTVKSGDKEFGHGYVGSSNWATYSGSMKIVRSPSPIVSWMTSEDGEVFLQEVKLDSNPGGREVVFELDGKSVKTRIGPN